MPKKPKQISQQAWDDVDIPELTDADFARMRPASEVTPAIVTAYRRLRGKQKTPTKVSTTVRLDSEVIEAFRATGRGWQTRLNEALKQWLREHRS